MASDPYEDFFAWKGVALHVRLLPQFAKVEQPVEGWRDAMGDGDKQLMQQNRPVTKALAQAIARWCMSVAGGALHREVAHWWQGSRCKMLLKSKSGTGLIIEKDRYARVVIGYDQGGKPVMEGLHRLVCWVQHGVNVDFTYACHERKRPGDKGWGCRGKLCVHPRHMWWGDAQSNRIESLNRERRRLNQV